MANDNATTTADQAHARDEALGLQDGPCCDPTDDPCRACHGPDPDVYEPSEADLQWYRDEERRREMERRDGDYRLGQQIDLASRATTFQYMLRQMADAFSAHHRPDVAWLGAQVKRLAERAEWLEARSGEQFDDRLDAFLDSIAEDCRCRAVANG